jgi:putative toxin-antitoxin system antitoxin component (TIGR02293 family)
VSAKCYLGELEIDSGIDPHSEKFSENVRCDAGTTNRRSPLNYRQLALKLRQMPTQKTRNRSAEASLVHTHVVVKEGLETSSYHNLRGVLGVSDQLLAASLSIPLRTLQRRLERGRFMPDESDRIARLWRIYQRALEVFESADSAREWMQTPNPSIGFAVPLELCSTDPGCVEVDRLLSRIEYGVF